MPIVGTRFTDIAWDGEGAIRNAAAWEITKCFIDPNTMVITFRGECLGGVLRCQRSVFRDSQWRQGDSVVRDPSERVDRLATHACYVRDRSAHLASSEVQIKRVQHSCYLGPQYADRWRCCAATSLTLHKGVLSPSPPKCPFTLPIVSGASTKSHRRRSNRVYSTLKAVLGFAHRTRSNRFLSGEHLRKV